jgi:hypothetical protein
LGPTQYYSTDSARRVFGQSLGRDHARCRVAVPADHCNLPSRPPRAAATPCAMPLAGARTLASRVRQLCSRRHLKALLSADRCRQPPPSLHSRTFSRCPCTLPLAIGPEEKSFTPFPTSAVELPPLRSTSPSPPFPDHRRPPPLVLL